MVSMIYTTGTVSVGPGDTTIVGVDTVWSNLRSFDWIAIDNGAAIPIEAVVDVTHLTIAPWQGAAKAGVSYKAYMISPLRFDSGEQAADVARLVAALNTDGFYHMVPTIATAPDPSLGDEQQFAYQSMTGKMWLKELGTWTFIGIYKGFGLPAPWSAVKDYALFDVATLNGTAYVAIAASTNQSPPNATYWAVLAAKGDTGATGPVGPGYGGTSATSLTIGTGSRVFTTQTGMAYQIGTRIRAASAANSSNYMEGIVTAYSGTFLTANISRTNGAGTLSDWRLSVAGDPGSGDMLSTNNLSEVVPSIALTNLGGTSIGKALFTAANKTAARGIIVSDTFYNGADLGIIGDNATDNSAAIAAVIASMSGGVLVLPRGASRFSTPIDLTGLSGVTIRGCGPGNTTGNAPASTLRYTGTTTNAIKIGSAFGCALEDLWVDYTSASLTGNLIRIGNTTGVDSQFCSIRRCLIWSAAGNRTATLVNIDKSVGTTVEDCNLLGGNPSISGRSAAGYAIRTHIHRCQFGLSADYPIYFPGDAWTISNCDFVADASGYGRLITGSASAPLKNLSLLNNWSGDVTTTGATAIRLYGYGLLSQNNSWGGLVGSNCFGLNSFTNFKISLDTFDHFGGAVSYDTATCDYGNIEYCHRVSTTNLEVSTGNKGSNVALTNNN